MLKRSHAAYYSLVILLVKDYIHDLGRTNKVSLERKKKIFPNINWEMVSNFQLSLGTFFGLLEKKRKVINEGKSLV